MEIDLMHDRKIIPFQKLTHKTFLLKEKKKVLIGGCFDIFHYGHLVFLQKAKEQGDVLIIALESDEFILTRKRRQPVHSQKQRARILSMLTLVDFVVMLPYLPSNQSYLTLVKIIHPDVIAVTSGDPLLAEKRNQATQIGSRVEVVTPPIESFSTKRILTILRNEY